MMKITPSRDATTITLIDRGLFCRKDFGAVSAAPETFVGTEDPELESEDSVFDASGVCDARAADVAGEPVRLDEEALGRELDEVGELADEALPDPLAEGDAEEELVWEL